MRKNTNKIKHACTLAWWCIPIIPILGKKRISSPAWATEQNLVPKKGRLDGWAKCPISLTT